VLSIIWANGSAASRRAAPLGQEIRRFHAKSDDGKAFVVVEYQEFTEFQPISGARRRIPTTTSLRLNDGSYVQDDPEAFKIVDTDEIIREVR
jgi:hypothetical protein